MFEQVQLDHINVSLQYLALSSVDHITKTDKTQAIL